MSSPHPAMRHKGVHPSVRIHETARIECDELILGAGSVVNAGCLIEGTKVEVGRDFWMDECSLIGGGSCTDPCAFLKAGDFLHLGWHGLINIGRGVTIGDEVGIGDRVVTHGAYLPETDGFPCSFAPVTIGSRVWLPSARVHAGVTIGNDVVVAAPSVVHRDLPSGCLAGGIPCKVLYENVYPKKLCVEARQEILERIVREAVGILNMTCRVLDGTIVVVEHLSGEAVFDTSARTIHGRVSKEARIVRNQLRRHGIRFRFEEEDGRFVPWT
jgi:carbonic anhydrase/acetyltransferase-like protein (isoleucine patch superfamily)